MPRTPTRNSWRFPPRTTEVQLDEEWPFVAQKEANRDRSDPGDDHKGDDRDHVAFDPEPRPVVAVVPGARTIENTEASVGDFRRRTGGRPMSLMTSDDSPASETAILHAYYGEAVIPARTGKPGRPPAPDKTPPAGRNFAVAATRRVKGRAVEIGTRVVFGTAASATAALGRSKVSRAINTAFIGREDGTDRHRDARKARKTYRFSKDWRYHEAVTYSSLYCYNFRRPVRTCTFRDLMRFMRPS